MALHLLRALALLILCSGLARADMGARAAPLVTMTATPLFGTSGTGTPTAAPLGTGSLFTDTAAGGFFAPLPARARVEPGRPLGAEGAVADLLSLIARAEAGQAGYDAVQHGAHVRPPRAPTQMTLGEIYAWIDATPGQPHAIGRYQFIPPTLRRVASIRGYGPDTRFTPEVQDSLALVLLEDAGLRAFEGGSMPRTRFMQNLARIWAGLPLPNGRSHYEGYAGNRASMTWADFEGGVLRIWPTG